jgi:large subunit ribosomal protein L6
VSRIGKLPVNIPNGVKVEIKGASVNVTGPKGSDSFTLPRRVNIIIKDNEATVERVGNDRVSRSNHGLTRTLLFNLVTGVSEGYSKKLAIQGIGYRVELSGKTLIFNIGFSHPIHYTLPDDITAEVDPKANTVVLSGHSKWKVGQVAAIIRGFKPPEPYKGKGIRYEGEQIRRKVGKTA